MPLCDCGAAIEFVRTTTGKRMPVNAHPINVVLEKGPLRVVLEDGRVVSAREPKPGELEGVIAARTSHFATCSLASRFRAKGRTAP
jgi:hypothetical protein